MGASEKVKKPSGAQELLVELRPRHAALCAFVTTLLACTPVAIVFDGAPHYAALGATFLFCLLLAAMASSLFLCARSLQGGVRDNPALMRGAVVAYLIATLVFVFLLVAPQALLAGAAAAGLVAGCALPVVLCAWMRAVAAPMDRALALCALVGCGTSFAGWILTLLPLHLLLSVFCVLLVGGTVPLLFAKGEGAFGEHVSREPADQDPESSVPQIATAGAAPDALARLLSVTWLPLLGLVAYVFMTGLVTHSAFGVVPVVYPGALLAAAVVLAACARWARRPLLPWCYRVLVPLLAAVFVVLGAFPAGTFPQEVSIVALYGFYLVLAVLGCALFLAVANSREVSPGLACSFAVAVVAAAALFAQILSSVVLPGADFSLWLPVVTGLFVAVLLVFLGRTAWDELIAPQGSAPDGGGIILGDGMVLPDRTAEVSLIGAVKADDAVEAPAAGHRDAPETPYVPEPSVRDTLEARCAEVSAARSLSPREAEVLVYLARGFTPAYIAKSLVLSISTVRTHVRNIYRKLGVNKREELLHLIDEE